MEARHVNKRVDDGHFRRMVNDLVSEVDRLIKITILEFGPNDSATRQAELQSRTEEKLTRLQRTNKGNGVFKAPYSHLNQCLKDRLSSCIRDELGRVRGDFEDPEMHDTLVSACCKRILESPQYEAFKQEIYEAVSAAAAELVTRPVFMDTSDCQADSDLEEGAWSFYDVTPVSNDVDTSSVASSSDGGGTVCWFAPSSERLEELAERLDPRHHLTVRLEALRTLASLPLAEMVTFESWPYVKQRLLDILSGASSEDNRTVVFEASLNLHAKMLLSSSSQCVVESFGNLVVTLYRSLETRWHSGRTTAPRLDGTAWHAILQLANLINAFQKVVPNYWTRFPEQHSRTIVEFTIRYLMDDAVLARPLETLSDRWAPLHLLGVVDPNAVWFRNWSRAEYGRRLLWRELHHHAEVLPNLMVKCHNAMEALGRSTIRSHQQHSSSKAMPLDRYEVPPPSYVEYCSLLHMIAILGRVMSSAEGRRLCDEQMNTASQRFRSRQLLGAMLKMSIELSRATGPCNGFCAARSIVDIFRRLTEQETSCQYYFVDDLESIQSIADWLRQWCDNLADHIHNISNHELHCLNHVADILFHLSDSVVVLPVLSGSRATIVASFTEHLLLISKDAVMPSNATILEDVKLTALRVSCRVFSMHDGIEVLCRTQLLRKVAEEWEWLLRDDDLTPVPGATTVNRWDRAREWLQELSTIGSTPLGLAALHQADLLQDVIDWAERELQDKVQFSLLPMPTRLMLSQVATISNVKLGFTEQTSQSVEFIAESIWKACENSCLDDRSIGGLPVTEERLTLLLARSLSDLVCVLPSRVTVKTSQPVSDEMTSAATEMSLLARIVISGVEGSFAKSELIHETGTRLLGLLATSLDTWLHLQARYLLQEALLKAQQLNALEETGQVVMDGLLVSRNYLLVKTTEIGGENEKLLPPNVFDQESIDVESLSQWPIVISLPIPNHYLPVLAPVSSPPLEIELFLKESRLQDLDQEWLPYCREVYRNCHTSEEQVQLRSKWFGQLLYYALEAMAGKSDDTDTAVPVNAEFSELTNVAQLGSTLAIRYGIRLGLLENEDFAMQNMINILVSIQNKTDMQEFDWITATAFLLMCGDLQRTTAFRRRLKVLGIEKQLASCKQPVTSELFPVAWLTFCHNVEVVLQGDLPLVAHALQWSGISVGQVCQPWISQCFWNILDWEEICNYFGLCVLIGDDYIVYFVVALFRHLQTEIYQHARNGDVSIFLRETRLEGFCTRDYLPFMDHLESKYHNLLQHAK